jgi:AraC-like DNA-binding protein
MGMIFGDVRVDGASTLPARGGLTPRHVGRLRRHVDERLAEPIRIEDLAAVAGLSPGHFRRAFKASFGVSPHSYIVHRRVAHAQRMMLASRENLSQIALACGLCDQSHLCNVFQREVGMPPAAWRRRHGAGTPPAELPRQSPGRDAIATDKCLGEPLAHAARQLAHLAHAAGAL